MQKHAAGRVFPSQVSRGFDRYRAPSAGRSHDASQARPREGATASDTPGQAAGQRGPAPAPPRTARLVAAPRAALRSPTAAPTCNIATSTHASSSGDVMGPPWP